MMRRCAVMSEISVAAHASRVRARLLFVLLDAISVCAGYGLAEVIYFRHRPPADYWQHFALFLAVAVVVRADGQPSLWAL